MKLNKVIKRIGIFSLGICMVSCASKNAPNGSNNPVVSSEEVELIATSKEFNAYWYNGTAELSTYELSQARYGEMHPGNEVLIFVTEDYNMKKQVKRESVSDDQYSSILKLNRIKRFTTGIYDYSMMTSVFKAVDTEKHPMAFKVNSSSQDWCGHTWSNLVYDENGGYTQHLDSYFESEAGEDKKLGKAMSEDAVFTQIRLDPNDLPQGKFRMIPSMNYSRFSHVELKPEEVSGKLLLESTVDETELHSYTLEYTSGRTIKIYFEPAFPYTIQGWEEKRKSGFGDSAKWLTTIATLKNIVNTNYWAKHSTSDVDMRKMLGL
ncbi:MAG: hypothetical protein ACI8XB_001313 [Patiriisocius sp.]|jgi:hypothetical protein